MRSASNQHTAIMSDANMIGQSIHNAGNGSQNCTTLHNKWARQRELLAIYED
jgi:hypothetical protein